MITTYLDKNCKSLKNSQGLDLCEDYSALWFCMSKEDKLSNLFQLTMSTFNCFDAFCWLAFSSGSNSPKILELKRAFGHWSIPKREIVFKYDSLDKNGEKLYSDVARVNRSSIDSFIPIYDRNLFGIDSVLFFLPSSVDFTAINAVKPLTDLLVERSREEIIGEKLQSCGMIESYINSIIALEGIATIVLRDSNMATIIVALGNQFTLSRMSQGISTNTLPENWREMNEIEFKNILDIGTSISALN